MLHARSRNIASAMCQMVWFIFNIWYGFWNYVNLPHRNITHWDPNHMTHDCWDPKVWDLASHTTQSFDFSLQWDLWFKTTNGTTKVVLYDRWSFIRGINVWKCRSKFLLKWSLIGGLSLNAVALNHRFQSSFDV